MMMYEIYFYISQHTTPYFSVQTQELSPTVTVIPQQQHVQQLITTDTPKQMKNIRNMSVRCTNYQVFLQVIKNCSTLDTYFATEISTNWPVTPVYGLQTSAVEVQT